MVLQACDDIDKIVKFLTFLKLVSDNYRFEIYTILSSVYPTCDDYVMTTWCQYSNLRET